MLTVVLKHGARTLPGVSVERAGGAAALLAAVERATGVPQARAKLMQKAWKGTRPADADVAALADGTVVTVMGTAETATAAASAASATMFVEDMPLAEQAALGQTLPVGLANEQNT
jgi:hypothetical protein